jgi:cation transport regulator ChaC
MFITLTNMSVQHRGKPIVLNSSMIVSMMRTSVVRDEATQSSETVTYVFIPPHGTWEVSETVEEILECIRVAHS